MRDGPVWEGFMGHWSLAVVGVGMRIKLVVVVDVCVCVCWDWPQLSHRAQGEVTAVIYVYSF